MGNDICNTAGVQAGDLGKIQTGATLASQQPSINLQTQPSAEAVEKANEERAEKRKLLSVLNSISDGLFVLDNQLVVTFFNKSAEKLLARRSEDIVGRRLFDAFPEARGSIFESQYTLAVREKKAVSFETYFEAHQNWYDVRVYPNENGISVYFQVTTARKRLEEELRKSNEILEKTVQRRTADLSEMVEELFVEIGNHKQTEKRLVESERRYHTLFENVPVPLAENDYSLVKALLDNLRQDGVQDFAQYFARHPEAVIRCANAVRIIDVNLACLKLYKARDKGELAAGFPHKLGEEAYEVLRDALVTLLQGQTWFAGEAIIGTSQGTQRNVYLTLAIAPGYEDTWARVLVSLSDITERKAYEAELQNLSRRLIEVHDQERRAIGRELHDEIGQTLTALKLMLGHAARSRPEKSLAILAEVDGMVQALMGQVRKLSLDLQPVVLDELGLLQALHWHFEKFTHQTHITVDFINRNLSRDFRPELAITAYRIIQEALTNIARHSGATHVNVRASTSKENLFLEVEDKGNGFDITRLTPDAGSGLSGMRERALLIGGTFRLKSSPASGTTINVRLPLYGKQRSSPPAPRSPKRLLTDKG